MATAYTQLSPEEAQFLAATFPQYIKNNGTNFPVPGLAYDAATQENAFWRFRAAQYSTGNLTLDIDWYADTATSGAVVWGAAIAAITADTDTTDIETKAYATANEATDTHLGTTGQRLHRASITISNLDSLAAEDWVSVKIYRKAADGADTMTGDAILTLVTISYTTA